MAKLQEASPKNDCTKLQTEQRVYHFERNNIDKNWSDTWMGSLNTII